jgi:hypothetical protein
LPRTLTRDFREHIFQSSPDAAGNATAAVLLLLLTIDETSLLEPIRYVLNTEDVTSRGNVYSAAFFDVKLPDEDSDALGFAQLVVQNVDRRIVEAIEQAGGRPKVTFELVLSNNPDVVEVGPYLLELDSVEYNAQTVTGTLVYDEVQNYRAMKYTYSPLYFPDLF